MAATASLLKNFKITHDEGLAWHASSEYAQRGFCKQCGSNLFWKHNDARQISITAGTFDDDSDFVTWGHIFSSDKGHYYKLPDDEIQCQEKPTDFPVMTD
jgi:hypothetical protein